MDEKSDNLSTLRDYSLDNTQQHVTTCESHTQHFVIIEFCSLLRRVLDVLHHPCVTLLHVIIKAMKIDDKSQSSKILKNRKLPFHTAEFWLYRTFSFFSPLSFSNPQRRHILDHVGTATIHVPGRGECETERTASFHVNRRNASD